MPGRKHGSGGQLKMDPTGGATTVAVADLNTWTLDMARETVDVTAFQDPNKQYVLGLPDIKGTYGGWWNSASTPALFRVCLGNVAAMLELVPSIDEPTFLFKGLAYLDGSIDVSATGAISIDGNYVGAGPWVMEPPPV
jgi:hypothetical protein